MMGHSGKLSMKYLQTRWKLGRCSFRIEFWDYYQGQLKNRKTLDNNDLNQIGHLRVFSKNKGLGGVLRLTGS